MPLDFAGLGTDGFVILVFWLLLILGFAYWEMPFPMAFSLAGVFEALFPDNIPGDFAQFVVFMLLGVVLQYFASLVKPKAE